MAARLLALSVAIAAADEIHSIVTTREGVQRPATKAQLPAYEWYNKGVLSSSRNEMATAIAEFEEALRILPTMPEALLNLGNLYERPGRKSKAGSGAAAAATYQSGQRRRRRRDVAIP